MSDLERQMNNSIAKGTEMSQALVGRFGSHPKTHENAIVVGIRTASTTRREFCYMEIVDCSSKSEISDSNQSPNQLICPSRGRNKQCGTFEWKEFQFEKDDLERKFCIAFSTTNSKTASHDRNSCSDYGSTRLWFRQSTGNEMFRALTAQLNNGKQIYIEYYF